MSKLFKELNYDTDLVMQPGDGDSIAYATCSTASGTTAKAATVQGKTGFTLSQGATVCVKFTAASTDAVPTLNVNSTGAKPIYYNGSAVSASNPFRWSSNTIVTFVYDGAAWNAIGVQTHYYATCVTGAATQEKAVVVEGGVGFVMAVGTQITVRFNEANTYAGQVTANVEGTGALTIRLNRATTNATTNPLFWTTGSTVTFCLYPGSSLYWDVMDYKRTEYAPCGTAANTAAKTTSALARGIVLSQGSRFAVRFTYENTVANPTLTLPGLSSYPICDSSGNALSVGGIENWDANDIVVFVFLYNTGKSEFQYQIENSYMSKKLASSIQDAQVETTYADLKSLRDSGQLIPGQQYRITDYVTTVGASATSLSSAGKPFDLIVVADSTNKLNDKARAIQHAGDTYFANSRLQEWQVWYCLDNDTNHFQWADTTNGKGVIYRLIDEFQNDVPCDFKNIKIRRYAITAISSDVLDEEALECLEAQLVYSSNGNTALSWVSSNINWIADNNITTLLSCTVDANTAKFYFTFDDGTGTDASLLAKNHIYCNKICPYEYGSSGDTTNFGKLFCNVAVFLGTDCYNNTIGCYCNAITFGKNCFNNIIGPNCGNLVFCYNCHDNTVGYDCTNMIFGQECYCDKIESNCNRNVFSEFVCNCTFGESAQRNAFGAYVYDVHVGSYFDRNIINSEAYYLRFGNENSNNIIGYGAMNIELGNACTGNYVGGGCDGVVLGSNCTNNILRYNNNGIKLGDNCYGNFFDNNAQSITLCNRCFDNVFGLGSQAVFMGDCCFNNFLGPYAVRVTLSENCKHNTFGTYDSVIVSDGSSSIDAGSGLIAYRDSGLFERNKSIGQFSTTKQYAVGDLVFYEKQLFKCTTAHKGVWNAANFTATTFAEELTPATTEELGKQYCTDILFEGNMYLKINPTGSTSSSSHYQNVVFGFGVNGTSQSGSTPAQYKTITDSATNQTYRTLYQPANSTVISV